MSVVTETHCQSKDGVPIALSIAGEGDTNVVLIHGWACDRTFWEGQIEPLAAGYRVVAVDLPGHGRSGAGRRHWTLEAFGGDIATVVRDLDLGRSVLVGHSMGGPVALEASRLLPEQVIGVVGVDTLHDAEFRFQPRFWKRHVQALEEDFDRRCTVFVRALFLADADADKIEQVVARMCASPREIAVELMRHFGEYDLARTMGEVRVPIRAINSPLTPTRIETNRKYADFDAVIMPGVGHFPMIDRPLEFHRTLVRVIGELAG